MKTRMLFCCLMLAAGAMQAQIHHVTDTSYSIQEAIDTANNGDTILVYPGRYFEKISFLGKKPLTVTSLYLTTRDTSYISRTILDGSRIPAQTNGSIVNFISGEDSTSVLCGFTITNGNKGTFFNPPNGGTMQAGGAIYTSHSGAKIIRNRITNNHLIPDTTLTVNPGRSGAGIECGDWTFDTSWVVIEGNTIDYNSCRVESPEIAFGAGISAICNVRIVDNLIANNYIEGPGGTRIAAAGFFVGGEANWSTTLVAEVRYNVIRDNMLEAFDLATGAGGLIQQITCNFSDNTVTNNKSMLEVLVNDNGSGGITLYGPRTGSMVSSNSFSGNDCQGSGGAVQIVKVPGNMFSDTVILQNNFFSGNTAMRGGAIMTDRNAVYLENNVFRENRATLSGGALYIKKTQVSQSSHFGCIINNTFYKNIADNEGGAIYSERAKILILNSIFSNDSSALAGILKTLLDTAEIAFTDIDPSKITGIWTDGGNNINEDPLFADLTTLVLSEGSPCINTGTAAFTCQFGTTHIAPVSDIYGNVRPLGSSYDMGAFEMPGVGTGSHPGRTYAVAAYPNPLTTSTTISYDLPEASRVMIRIFDGLGRLVSDPVILWQHHGQNQFTWDASRFPSGMYHFQIESGRIKSSVKVIKE